MINRLLLLLFTALPYICFAQQEYPRSKEIKVTAGASYERVPWQSKNFFYDGKRYVVGVRTFDKRKVIVQCYDERTKKQISRNDYTDLSEHDVQPLLESNGSFYYLYSIFNKELKTDELISRKINPKEATLEPPVVLCRTPRVVPSYYHYESTYHILSYSYDMIKTCDSSGVLITYRVKPKTRKDDLNFDVYGYHVFDKDLKPKWNKEVQMPYVQTKIIKLASALTRDGKVYQLIYSKENRQFELLIIKSDQTVENKLLTLDGGLLFSEFQLNETADKKLLCTSFYANETVNVKGRDERMVISSGLKVKAFISDGLYYAKLSPQGTLLEEKKFEIPLKLLNDYEELEVREENKLKEKEGFSGVRDLLIKEQFICADGGTLVVGEQQYYTLNASADARYATPTYYFGDIYVIKVDAEDKLMWMKKIPKNQSMSEPSSLGITCIHNEGSLFIFFADNYFNLALSSEEPSREGVGGISLYKVNEATGQLGKYHLEGSEEIPGVGTIDYKPKKLVGTGKKTFIEGRAGKDSEAMVGFELTAP